MIEPHPYADCPAGCDYGRLECHTRGEGSITIPCESCEAGAEYLAEIHSTYFVGRPDVGDW